VCLENSGALFSFPWAVKGWKTLLSTRTGLCGCRLKMLFSFGSIVIPGFSHLEIHDQSQSQSRNITLTLKTTDGQSTSPSWCQEPIWDLWPFFLFFLNDRQIVAGFVDAGPPLWREVWSVVYSWCWVSPEQSFSGLSPAGLMTIFYCLNIWDSANLKGQVSVFISPWNRVVQL
jgi:hypothetical protein